MKHILSADFFELRKAKMTYILPAISLLLGALLPLMYYGIYVMFKLMGDLDIPGAEMSMASVDALLGSMTAKNVFLSVLPLSQGVGILITAMIAFRTVRPFSTGVYRNKVIAQIPRGAIYLSQSFCCLILTVVSACLYTLCAALFSSLTFGDLDLSGHEITSTVLLSLGIYLVYTAIPVYAGFRTRSVPLSILVSVLLPVLTQTIVSFISVALMNAPEIVAELVAVLPAFQNMYLLNGQATDTILAIALVSDVVIVALLTLSGILHFRKTDLT